MPKLDHTEAPARAAAPEIKPRDLLITQAEHRGSELSDEELAVVSLLRVARAAMRKNGITAADVPYLRAAQMMFEGLAQTIDQAIPSGKTKN
ncbi:MAG TPA: hypothetical protein VHC22_10275 [Pirellulales bacterium]|nr:hypothetical protein [Pirellulales bacterium]